MKKISISATLAFVLLAATSYLAQEGQWGGGGAAAAIQGTGSAPSSCVYNVAADPVTVYTGTFYVCGPGNTYVAITGGTGLTSLNGLTGSTQTFSGSGITISSVGSTHTFTVNTLNQSTTGSAASLSIAGQTGLLTFTGLSSTNRAKTVRDAADTILELGGSYTPTGTWNWQSAVVTWPTFNQSTSGTAATATDLAAYTSYSVFGAGNGAKTWITPTGNSQCLMSAASNYQTTTPSFQTCSSGLSGLTTNGVLTAASATTGQTTTNFTFSAGALNLPAGGSIGSSDTGSPKITFGGSSITPSVTITGSISGNAGTATALASTPSQCGTGLFATGVAASGNANCTPSSAPSTKGIFYSGWNLSSDAAAASTYLQVGFSGRAVSGSSDTILYSDVGKAVEYTGSGAVAVTLPTGTTLENTSMGFAIWNETTGSSTAVTVTPTTWQINSASTLVIAQGQYCTIFVDPAGNTWDATCRESGLTPGTDITLTRSSSSLQVGLTSAAVTVNGQTCTLGSTCNVNSGATSGTLAINGGNGSAMTGLGTAGADYIPISTVANSFTATQINGGADCGDGTHAVKYTESTHTFGCQTLTTGGAGTVTQIVFSAPLSGGTITSSGTVGITGVIGEILAGATPAFTATPTLAEAAAPGSPASSYGVWWQDSTDHRFHDKEPGGTIGTTVVKDTGASNNFLTAISAAGVISKAQPAFTNISGNATAAQGGTGLTTLTAHNFMLGEGTSNVAFLSCGAGTTVLGNAADPTCSAALVLGTDNSVAGTVQTASSGAAFHNIWGSSASMTATNTILGPLAVPTTLHLLGCTTASTTCTLTDMGIATQYNVLVGGASGVLADVAPSATSGIPLVSGGSSANPSFTTAVVAGGGTGAATFTAYAPVVGGTTTTGALQSTAVGTAKQMLVSGGNAAVPNYIDFPDVKIIPAANCVAATAGGGMSTPASGGFTATCRAGTNDVGGYYSGIPSTGAYAMFQYSLPGDWDTTVKPYIKIDYSSGANTSGNVIWTVSTACTKEDGSITDDPTWIAESAMGTQTMAAANRMWGQSAILAGAMTNCVAGSPMLIKVAVSSTASSAIQLKQVTVTTQRLLTVQAD